MSTKMILPEIARSAWFREDAVKVADMSLTEDEAAVPEKPTVSPGFNAIPFWGKVMR